MKLESNIRKLYISYFLSGLVFFYGMEKVFYEVIGIDAVGISAISVAYLIVALTLDIPSGVLADKWSRKYVLMIGSFFLAISSVVGGLSENLVHYIVAAIIWGVYYIFISGAYEALTYDSLHEQGRQKEFSRIYGRQNGLFLVGIVVASMASGYIAELTSLRTVYFLSVIPALINIALIARLYEPKFHDEIVESNVLKHIQQASKLLVSNLLMRRLSLLLIAILVLEDHSDEYGAVYFLELGFGVVAVGILGAMFAASAAFGQFIAHKLMPYEHYLILGMIISLLAFSFWQATGGLFFFMLAMFLRNALENISETEIQDNIHSSVRATTISVLGFASNLVTIPVVIGFGYIAREYTIFIAFQTLSIGLGLILGLIVLPGIIRNRAKATNS